MRVAFLSDIHGNLPALEAVIADARSHGVTHVICLGDCVGYGPQPEETLALVRRVASACVMGNHDAAACGLLDPALFNDFARESAERVALALAPEKKAWLRDLPYILEGDGFACAHGGFERPESFHYLETKEDALLNVEAMPGFPLLVVGHTHIPCAFIYEEATGTVRKVPPSSEGFTLLPGSRYVLNPGAVGFPRSDHLSADYLLYDTVTRHVAFRSIVYDLAPYRLAVVRNGYNILNYWFLSPSARRRQTEQAFLNPTRAADAPLKQGSPFRPRRHHRSLSRGAWMLIALFLALGIGACVALWRTSPKATPVIFALPGNNVLPPLGRWTVSLRTGAVTSGTPLQNVRHFSPENGALQASLLSPLCPVPRAAERLRLTFRVKAARVKGLAYNARVRFFLNDGTQRLDRIHAYKRPDIQAYAVEVPDDAHSFRVEINLTSPVACSLMEPSMRVY